MKTAIFLFFVLVMYATIAKAGLPPTNLKGQSDTSAKNTFFFQTPGKQATQVAPSTGLIETGNTNILENPSFEHSTAITGWSSAVTGTATNTLTAGSNSTNELGAKRLNFSCAGGASGGTCTISQDQNTSKTVQGLALAYISTDTPSGVKLKPRANGAEISGLEVSANTTSEALYKVPFTLGSSSSGLEVEITVPASTTITGTVDAAFVGAVDLKADVDQSRIAGESYFAGTASCTWSRTNTSVGAFGTVAACPGPTIVTSTMGQWQTTDSDLPRQTINNLPAGTYKAKFIAPMDTSNGNGAALAINDGTTTCEAVNSNNTLGTVIGQVVECTFVYTSSGNRTFELYGASTANSIRIQNAQSSAPRTSTKFILEYFGSGSVYTSTNADTDWASFTPTGTWVSNTSYAGKFRLKGSMLEAQYQVSVSGAPTTASLSMDLPSGYTIDTSKFPNVPTSTREKNLAIQCGIRDISPGSAFPCGAWYEDTNTFTVFAYSASTTYAESAVVSQAIPMTWASGDVLTITISVPVVGRSDSNIIIGQFNGLESCANTLECTDTLSASVSSTGVVSNENVNFVNGNCTVASTNQYTCPFVSGIFTVAPNCIGTVDLTTGARIITIESTSSSQVVFRTATSAPAASAEAFKFSCQKQGADYIGKTAKAVASDQNIATPGVTKVKACYYAFGGASATLASPTECTTGTCTEVVDTCGMATPPTRSAAGVYTNLTIASGTFAANSFLKCDCTAFSSSVASRSCISYFDTGDNTWASNSSGGATLNFTSPTLSVSGSTITQADAYLSIECKGQAP